MRYRHALAAALALTTVNCTVTQPPVAGDRGRDLFVRHCTACHGATGDADTDVADLLLPRPNAFRDGLFKLVSTTNGIPTDDDLVRMLRHGMPGSTMMSFGWMPESDLRALAGEVRRLTVQGRARSIQSTAAITGRPLRVEQAHALAEQELQPGDVIATGEPARLDDDTIAAGKTLYLRHCASCHGIDASGLPQTQHWQRGRTWLWPRDFTSGYLRGAASHQELAWRIRAGMPGAHMPPTALTEQETSALVAYLRFLIPDGAGDRHAQWRRTVRVPRVDRLPPARALDTIRLPTVPLWWRAAACSEVRLQAAHDGTELLFVLSWDDSTRDDRIRPDATMSDGIAIQFSREAEPPLFPMGSARQPVNAWRWHAYDPKQLAGITDLVWNQPHRGFDVPGPIQLEPQSESVQFGGIGSVGREAGTGLPLQVKTEWNDGRWRATFRRALAARDDQEIDLTADGPLLFALAVWNGAIDPHPGSKSITTWHVLQLER